MTASHDPPTESVYDVGACRVQPDGDQSGFDGVDARSSPEGDMNLKLDVLRIEQVFLNLFENSLAASVDPVRIWVDCVREQDNELRITIRDNGPGLSIEQRERVFEPFYTTKSTGTGLGMSIVQRIVQAHHRRIEVSEPPRSGAAVFTIHLPSAPWAGSHLI